ncbi:hypothetical protein KA977_08390 [Candidatus Dependentiae bacterium]|nr:hypothetical protein [Candidatus Dependentiae bacterium]
MTSNKPHFNKDSNKKSNDISVLFDGKAYPVTVWKPWLNAEVPAQTQPGYIGPVFAIDTETESVRDGYVPEFVIGTVFNGNAAYLLTRKYALEFLEAHRDSTIYMQNAKFDIAVLSKLTGYDFSAQIESGKIIDPGILYRLIGIAQKGIVPHKYRLDILSQDILGIELTKDTMDACGNEVRTNFEQYLNPDKTVRYNDIPTVYIDYAVKDAIATYLTTERLLKESTEIISEYKLPTNFGPLTHTIQLMGDVALGNIMTRGICVDIRHVIKTEAEIKQQYMQYLCELKKSGFEPGQKGCTVKYNDIMNSIQNEYNIKLPVTDKTNKITQCADDLKPYINIPFVKAYVGYKKCEKNLSTFLSKFHAEKIYAYYDLLKVTGRASCSNPNLQNLPTKGNIRGCFVPADGYYFLAVDYRQLELVALAQVCFIIYGKSVMRDLINNDDDLHRWFASKIYQKTISEITDDERKTAKACNFGFPGGMGSETFRIISGLGLTLERCGELKRIWLDTFPEMAEFLSCEKLEKRYDFSSYNEETGRNNTYACAAFMGIVAGNTHTKQYERKYTDAEKNWAWGLLNEMVFERKNEFTGNIYTQSGSSELLRAIIDDIAPAITLTGRVRARVGYCDSKNTQFQGLAADGAKIALYNLIKRGYRGVAFIHDEVIVELPIENCNHKFEAENISKIMIESMGIVCPDVRIKTEYALMRRWTKGAKSVFDKDGNLVPYDADTQVISVQNNSIENLEKLENIENSIIENEENKINESEEFSGKITDLRNVLVKIIDKKTQDADVEIDKKTQSDEKEKIHSIENCDKKNMEYSDKVGINIVEETHIETQITDTEFDKKTQEIISENVDKKTQILAVEFDSKAQEKNDVCGVQDENNILKIEIKNEDIEDAELEEFFKFYEIIYDEIIEDVAGKNVKIRNYYSQAIYDCYKYDCRDEGRKIIEKELFFKKFDERFDVKH